jgi:hypothetical protein
VVVFSFAGGDRLVFWLASADLAIRRLVPDGEVWLPVKASPNFGHGRRWRRLFIVTLLKALSL